MPIVIITDSGLIKTQLRWNLFPINWILSLILFLFSCIQTWNKQETCNILFKIALKCKICLISFVRFRNRQVDCKNPYRWKQLKCIPIRKTGQNLFYYIFLFPYVRHFEVHVKKYNFESHLRSLNTLKCKIQNILRFLTIYFISKWIIYFVQ